MNICPHCSKRMFSLLKRFLQARRAVQSIRSVKGPLFCQKIPPATQSRHILPRPHTIPIRATGGENCRDQREYAIYDRFSALNIKDARRGIQFNPYFYEAVPPAFPITREAALAGETGIPDTMKVLIRRMESNWPGAALGRN